MTAPAPSLRETIPTRRGHTLAGRAVLPAVPDTPSWVLFSHCFTCGKDLKGYHHLARALADGGWASLRFDFTGLGESGGRFGDTDLDGNIADLVDAGTHLAAKHTAPRLLVGHSLGGVAALLAASELPSLEGLVLVGAPSDLIHLPEAVPAIRTAAKLGQRVPTTIGGRRVEVGAGLLPSLDRHDLRATLEILHIPVLILHAPGDGVVPFAHAERLARWAGDSGTLVSLEGADHLLSSTDMSGRAAKEIGAWAPRG